jgi:hypothetical protein
VTTLYIRSALDMPHAIGRQYGLARCGQSLGGAQKITELQALVFLGDRRCVRCFPSAASHFGERAA